MTIHLLTHTDEELKNKILSKFENCHRNEVSVILGEFNLVQTYSDKERSELEKELIERTSEISKVCQETKVDVIQLIKDAFEEKEELEVSSREENKEMEREDATLKRQVVCTYEDSDEGSEWIPNKKVKISFFDTSLRADSIPFATEVVPRIQDITAEEPMEKQDPISSTIRSGNSVQECAISSNTNDGGNHGGQKQVAEDENNNEGMEDKNKIGEYVSAEEKKNKKSILSMFLGQAKSFAERVLSFTIRKSQ